MAQAVQQSIVMKKPSKNSNRFKYNQLLYNYFIGRDFTNANILIEKIHQEFGQSHEFANLIHGYILKMTGKLTQSTDTFRKCLLINEKDSEVLKNISKNLQLQGRYKASLEVAQEALKQNPFDWELYYLLGNYYQISKDQNKAISYYQKALDISKNETIFLKLGRLYTQAEKYGEAIQTYQLALQFTHQNQEIKSILGTLMIRLGDTQEAMKWLEEAITMDQNDVKALLGLGGVQQDLGEFDNALNHYRKILQLDPNSGQIWNNIGMCYFGQDKLLAAVACLRKALYFEPFDWIIHYNLGLVHLHNDQNSTAFHFFQTAISLSPDEAQPYMYLGIALDRLGDYQNAQRSFNRALELDEDYLIYLNFCIIMIKRGSIDKAKELFTKFNQKFAEMKEDSRCSRKEVEEKRKLVHNLLNQQL